ncbi:MAG: tRNA (guanosine(46)-N7)-methyltransferase TrmB [Calditrichaeota bacterium]|nr:tRNA (guanosine(46)-N7)-methyltransferase TrmB [Calditrichota bacterium]
MPHVILNLEGSFREALIRNLPAVFQLENYRVRYRKAYFDPSEETALVETLLLEKGFRKSFYCRVSRRKDSRVVVHLDPVDRVERTPAVQLAVARLGFLLQTWVPGVEISRSNLVRYLELFRLPQDQQSDRYGDLLSFYRRSIREIRNRAAGERAVLQPIDFLDSADWEQIFGNQNPVEVEIGPGKGRFLFGEARRRPEVNFLAIEWAGRYMQELLARQGRKQLPNIRLAHADARRLFRDWIPENSIQAVHIYFPDPWWKKRHAKRKLVDPELIRNLEKSLQEGGFFNFATDVEEYFQGVLQVMADFPNFQKISEKRYSPDDPENPDRSNFETKMRQRGRWVYEVRWKKFRQDLVVVPLVR